RNLPQSLAIGTIEPVHAPEVSWVRSVRVDSGQSRKVFWLDLFRFSQFTPRGKPPLNVTQAIDRGPSDVAVGYFGLNNEVHLDEHLASMIRGVSAAGIDT